MTGMLEPLRIVVMGADWRLNEVLARNLNHWGYVASIWESSEKSALPAAPVDVLLFDLDGIEETLLTGGANADALEEGRRPPARLTVALGSQGLRRKGLEALEAVLFVQKPFDIGLLRGYLMTLGRVLRGELAQPQAMPPTGEPVRVLVADDDSVLAELICAMLTKDGRYYARAARDGIEVLETCMTWSPHCLVMDMMMPRMNGYQVLRCLQARPNAERLPVVVLSALTGVEVRPEEFEHPSMAVIEKPLRSKDLLAAVERVLSMKLAGGSHGSVPVS